MIDTVSVIGAGTMGNGIAHVFAQHGFTVYLADLNAEQLEKAVATIAQNLGRQYSKGIITEAQQQDALRRLHTTTSLAESVVHAQLVLEAATENTTVKMDIFRQLDRLAPAGTLLASNTSSISITQLAAATGRPEKVIGMHFMNPVPVMKLVEIINGYATSPETTAAVEAFCRQLGKEPCVVNDYPGFIANRILMPMINEAVFSLFEGVAGVQEIDTVMRLGMAHPMGPLQLADFIGLDICLSILNILYNGFGQPKYAPCPLLVNMVNAGKLGVKSGEGFYTYSPGSRNLVVSPRFAK